MGIERCIQTLRQAVTQLLAFEALYSNTTGTNNTAYGFRALRQSSTASNNTAIGRDALYSNTTGANNTAHGYRAFRIQTQQVIVIQLLVGRQVGL
jgi:hypothetical protein